MEWKTLLSPKRERESAGRPKSADLRSEFEKDYHRIIGSASFRRLQDKTQVFPLDSKRFYTDQAYAFSGGFIVRQFAWSEYRGKHPEIQKKFRFHSADERGYFLIFFSAPD